MVKFLLINFFCKHHSVNAGCKALPALFNIVQVMQQTQVGHILSKDELPVNNFHFFMRLKKDLAVKLKL